MRSHSTSWLIRAHGSPLAGGGGTGGAAGSPAGASSRPLSSSMACCMVRFPIRTGPMLA